MNEITPQCVKSPRDARNRNPAQRCFLWTRRLRTAARRRMCTCDLADLAQLALDGAS